MICSGCGAQLPAGAKFCGACGAPLAPPATFGGDAAAMPQKLDYSIIGDNLQMARVRLAPGQQVYAEAGRMVYKTPNVAWETRMTGETLGDKLIGALKRTVTGESLFVTYFYANGPGEVGFAGSYPGRIQAFDLMPGQSILVQREAFLFAQPTVQFNVALVKRLGAGFFGGEGFILEQFTGPGAVFIHAGGDFLDLTLGPGEALQIETGCIVAFDESVNYDIEFVGGIRTALFGGEGLFLATLTGPGRVVIQSMTLQRMRRELAPGQQGSHDRNSVNALGGLFGGGSGD